MYSANGICLNTLAAKGTCVPRLQNILSYLPSMANPEIVKETTFVSQPDGSIQVREGLEQLGERHPMAVPR